MNCAFRQQRSRVCVLGCVRARAYVTLYCTGQWGVFVLHLLFEWSCVKCESMQVHNMTTHMQKFVRSGLQNLS